MSLLRRLYLEFEDDVIMMGYKRPFGNSYVIGDVRDEMVKYNYYSKLKGQHYTPTLFDEGNHDDSWFFITHYECTLDRKKLTHYEWIEDAYYLKCDQYYGLEAALLFLRDRCDYVKSYIMGS